jgi:hypothetical protein
MTIQPIHLILVLEIGLLVMLPVSAYCREQQRNGIDHPKEYQLERMVGNQIETSVRVSAWKAPEPQRTNLFIYSVAPPQVDEALMRRVADRLAVKGAIEEIRGETLGHMGYWIKEPNPTNSAKWREIKLWLTMPSFTYSAGDDGFRWDIARHRPLMSGVPDKEQAKVKALELLPVLGLGTNDLQHRQDGRLDMWSSAGTTSYTDRNDRQRKTVVKEQSVSFWQRVPGGGTTVGVGDGGNLRFSFISEGKVSGIEWCFRKMQKAGEGTPKTSKTIIRDLRNRNAWTWHQDVPDSVTITNCVLAYPQGNSWLYQEHVWPFYMVTGVSPNGKTVTLYVPLEW